jgi:hypothetical protein
VEVVEEVATAVAVWVAAAMALTVAEEAGLVLWE